MDDDGSHYMVYAAGVPLGNGVKIVKLNDDCTEITEGPFRLEFGEEKRAPEGPYIMKKDGYYYLQIAASESRHFKGHHQLIARSENIYGPYEESPYNPLLAKEDKNCGGISHTAHGKIFSAQNGDYYVTFICRRNIDGFSILGRETAIEEISWTKDKWPIVNNGQGVRYSIPIPALPEAVYSKKLSDDFDEDTLSSDWLTVRNADKANLSLDERKGVLRIRTTEHDLNNIKHQKYCCKTSNRY